MSRIAAVATALPPHRHRQDELADAHAGLLGLPPSRRRLLDRLYSHAGVQTRHTALPLADYRLLGDLGTVNDQYVRHAATLGEEAVRRALARAGTAAADVDMFVVTSVTGVAVPSLDAVLMPRLGLRPNVKRVPVFGLGCVAGAAGLARVHDYLLAWPEQTAVLLSVELCSLSVPLTEATPGDLVVSALFGDGAGAAVVRGDQVVAPPRGTEGPDGRHVAGDGERIAAGTAEGPTIIATHSEVVPDTHDVLGWRLTPSGFRIVLTTELSDVVRDALGPLVKGFLADHGRQVQDVATWICHPGGPKVIDAVRDALGLDEKALRTARASLSEVGNMSSASVLHVLEKTLAERPSPARRGCSSGWARGSASSSCCWSGRRTLMPFYYALVVATCFERLAELVVAKRNARWSLARGGVETGRGHYPAMVVLHTGLLAGCLAEPWLAGRGFVPWLGVPMLLLAVAAQGLRWWCIRTLGPRWNTRVIVVPGLPLVEGGPYRWFRHPNYVAVVAEGIALPLAGSAWVTAVVFNVLNAWLLTVRLRCEAAALAPSRTLESGAVLAGAAGATGTAEAAEVSEAAGASGAAWTAGASGDADPGSTNDPTVRTGPIAGAAAVGPLPPPASR